MEYNEQDYLSVDLFRTMDHKDVLGGACLFTTERVTKPGEVFSNEVRMKKPSAQHVHAPLDTVNLYGFRPKHPDCWFLSVYQFWQYYNVDRLHQLVKGFSMEAE